LSESPVNKAIGKNYNKEEIEKFLPQIKGALENWSCCTNETMVAAIATAAFESSFNPKATNTEKKTGKVHYGYVQISQDFFPFLSKYENSARSYYKYKGNTAWLNVYQLNNYTTMVSADIMAWYFTHVPGKLRDKGKNEEIRTYRYSQTDAGDNKDHSFLHAVDWAKRQDWLEVRTIVYGSDGKDARVPEFEKVCEALMDLCLPPPKESIKYNNDDVFWVWIFVLFGHRE